MNAPASHTPTASPIQSYLEHLHRHFAGLNTGQVATYIPELAKANPASFGIAIATVDGYVYEVGATRERFTIQSISKPLVYGIALEDVGPEDLQRTVSVEPSGDAFNSISLEPRTGRPLNPMINAGAIATVSRVKGDTQPQRLARVVQALSAYAGRPLDIDQAVFESERATGHRNRAIGHMLRNYDVLRDDPEPALDLYFRQCSLLVDGRDLALIAATLANGGVNPVTGQRAVRSEFVGSILSVMTTCGMYDFAGEWVYRVGLPAKSGVGGGIIAVLPGQLGIGVFSPPLDERGNSVRGVAVCEALSRELGLHFLQPPRASVSTIRSRYTLETVRSKRRWPPSERQILDERGSRVRVYELQGDLRFGTIEPVVRHVNEERDTLDVVLLDFKRVSGIDPAATRVLAWLVGSCAARGQQVVMTRVRRGELMSTLGAELDPRYARALSFQPQLDLGLEWCERQLVEQHLPNRALASIGRLAEHRLCADVSDEDMAWLERGVTLRQYESGTMIVRRGDPSDALYLLMRGEVSVVIELPHGGYKRLAMLSPGAAFGETTLMTGGTRSAHVRADTGVECYVLSADAFFQLERERPSLMIRLMHNLLKGSSDTILRLTAEVAALED